MRRIPNAISCLRIILSVTLPFLIDNKAIFVVIYLACGLSDFLDGYIARRLKSESIIGAKLDSIADMIMFGAIISILLMRIKLDTLVLLLVIVVTIIRTLNILVVAIKFRQFAILHTILNKMTGALLFVYPIWYVILQNNFILIPLGIIAILSSLEEFIIHITSTTIHVDRKCLFMSDNNKFQ